MSRYVNADRLIEIISEKKLMAREPATIRILDMIENISTADVQEVRHGRWEVGYFRDRVCSCCTHPSNDLTDYPYRYCPNCGAKMDLEESE